MLKRKMISIRKLGRKASQDQPNSSREALLAFEATSSNDSYGSLPSSPALSSTSSSPSKKTPSGFFVIYVGEERERFVVPTSYLSHPLLKILLQKACDEFGFEQRNGLVLPCSVSTFQEVVNAVEGCHGRFDVAKILEEFE